MSDVVIPHPALEDQLVLRLGELGTAAIAADARVAIRSRLVTAAQGLATGPTVDAGYGDDLLIGNVSA